ncbi:ERF family protein [Vagococcus lutrae]|uniref:ERF family protein n=1 Tax=Vagococcus lutrae TaxID=81947 RepID=UPI0028902119|nr:ERF family protein [Vagococcus lutrae]MDT2808353.1 ERF family protein [Vagococcus lutrae]
MTEEKTSLRDLPFCEKVVSIIFELKAPKNQYNIFGKYNYRSAEDILEAVKPLLFKYGLLLNLSDKIIQVGERYYVETTAELFDGSNQLSTTGQAREPDNIKGMSGSQITGTASSFARKYALNGLFLIDDTKDADTDEFANQTKRPTNKKVNNTITNDQASMFNTLLDDLVRLAGKTRVDWQSAVNSKLNVNKTIDKYTPDEYGKALQLVKAWQKSYSEKNEK